jgi:shikimate dehydrogenase
MSKITGKTKVIGIFGYPVEHSFSPTMHNAAFRALSLDFVYVPFHVQPEKIAQAVEGIRAMGMVGVNITIPHKSAVIKHLDELSPEAEMIGAVNTIINLKGVLKGYNTDALGFVKSMEIDAGIEAKGKRVMLLGAGGAARAVSVQLALSGASEIILTTPNPDEIGNLKQIITSHTLTIIKDVFWSEDEISNFLSKTDILINATPLGMHPHIDAVLPVRLDCLSKEALVCDLIYNPRETLLLQQARQYGLNVQNGIGMLLYQGAIAFQHWTGVEPPITVMRKALEEAL